MLLGNDGHYKIHLNIQTQFTPPASTKTSTNLLSQHLKPALCVSGSQQNYASQETDVPLWAYVRSLLLSLSYINCLTQTSCYTNTLQVQNKSNTASRSAQLY